MNSLARARVIKHVLESSWKVRPRIDPQTAHRDSRSGMLYHAVLCLKRLSVESGAGHDEVEASQHSFDINHFASFGLSFQFTVSAPDQETAERASSTLAHHYTGTSETLLTPGQAFGCESQAGALLADEVFLSL